MSAQPRGLGRDDAAAWCGVGPTTFDRAVAEGLMPRPRKLFGRVIWDVLELAAAFDRLPHSGDAPDRGTDGDAGDGQEPFTPSHAPQSESGSAGTDFR